MLENVTFDELQIRRKVSLVHTLTQQGIALFVAMFGDVNPAHMNPDCAKDNVFLGIVGEGCGRPHLAMPPPKIQSWPLQVKLTLS